MSEKISLYNPRDTPPEQLEAMLTGREPLLKEILEGLREQVGGKTRQHWLLRGPRGIGKTHLTGIIHHRVRNDPVLSRAFLPLWLGEADVYEVYSPATLLERIAERLVEAVPGARIAEELRTLEGTGDEDALFEELAAHLTEEAQRQERTLLVLMENLDALFESFAPKQRKMQMRQLRSLLLDNPSFLFISTTPTRYLEELSKPGEPLYAHFKERRLKPLGVKEVGLLFSKLAQLTGRKELLGEGPEGELKQRIIHQLTGGLPRSVVMAFEVLRDKEGIQSLVEDMRVFLDAQTAYFEARLSRLAPRERAIVTTLALAERNLTLKEIAEKSRLPEKSLSTLVARLEQEGHVEAMDGRGGKGTPYALSEGLFRIWYQYRKGRMLLEPLVHFLAGWYMPDELRSVAEDLRRRLEQQEFKATRSARLALLQVEAAYQRACSEQGRLERMRIWGQDHRSEEEGVGKASTSTMPGVLETALSEGIALLLSGKTDKGRTHLERAIAPYEPLTEQLAFNIFRFAFQTIDRNDTAGAAGRSEALRWLVERLREQARTRPGSFLAGLAASLHNLGFALHELGRREEALEATREAVNHYREPVKKEPEPFRVALAGSLNNLGLMLHELGRREESLEAMRETVELYRALAGKEPEPFRAQLAGGLNNLGLVLHELGRREESLDAMREAVELYRALAGKEPESFRAKLTGGLNNLGLVLRDLGRNAEALEVVREAVEHDRALAAEHPDSLPDLAASLNNLGLVLRDLGRKAEALEATREAVKLHRVLAGKEPESFRAQLAGSLKNLGLVLRDLGRRAEVLEATREAVKHYRVLAEKEPEFFQSDLADSLNTLSIMLIELGRNEESLDVTRETVEHYRALARREPESFRAKLVSSLNNLGFVLSRLGRKEASLEVIREAVGQNRTLAAEHPGALPNFAMSLNNLGLALSDLEKKQEAIEAMREAVEHYSKLAETSPETYLSRWVNSLVNLGLLQSLTGREKEALASIQLGLTKGPVETVSLFTAGPTRFFKKLPAREVLAWLDQMLEAELPPEFKEQLRLHRQVATFLVDRDNDVPEERMRQALSRVPPELRDLVESILGRTRPS
jgi:tetratricopeptide (TPR) repeat protein